MNQVQSLAFNPMFVSNKLQKSKCSKTTQIARGGRYFTVSLDE